MSSENHVYTFAKQVEGGILGGAVGDALGVPVEFMPREEMREAPISGMLEGGTHNQPAGTWSDDTSMVLCTVESLIAHGIDYSDQMTRFCDWLWNARNTAHNEVFDVGGATKQSIFRFVKGASALECGETAENTCGNGSLMRLFPTAMYIIGQYGSTALDDCSAEIIHNTSKCTHQHPKCQMACGILFSVIASLSTGSYLPYAIKDGIVTALYYYNAKPRLSDVYHDFTFLLDIENWTEDAVKSSGYVIDTLQAALWCLYNSGSYTECVLKAVNLGGDTDTVGAIAGTLAGMWYGAEQIPAEWKKTTAKYDSIQRLSLHFYHACTDHLSHKERDQ